MVDFSQFRNTEDVPNWTARSQGVRAPDWGGIISDLGKSVVGGIEAVTKAEINTAEQQARNVVDETFTEYFPTEVAPSQKELPDGLKNSLSRIDTLGNAAKKAGLGKAAYFNAQIVSRLKGVRAQYGGLYDDEIDKTVTRYIGRNPRGELYDVLKEQEASQRRMMEAEYKSNLSAFSTDSAKVLFPNMTANEMANAPNNRDLLVQIRERESLVARVDEAKKLDYLDERTLEAEAAIIVQDTMTKVNNLVDFSKELSPQDFDTAVKQLVPLRASLVSELQKLELSFAGKMDGEKARAIIKRNIEFIEQVYSSFASGDLNATQAAIAANAYGKESVLTNLRRNNPTTFNQLALLKDLPPAASTAIFSQLTGTDEGQKFKESLGAVFLAAAAYGNTNNPVGALYNTLLDPEESEASKRKLLNDFLDIAKTGVSVSPEESKTMTSVISQPEKLSDISNLFTAGHAKFFTKLTTSEFISQHQPDNPDDYWGNILKAMTKTSGLMDDIVRMNDAARSAGSLSFNTSTGTLVYNRDPNKVKGGVYASSPFAPESPETAGESVAKQLMGQLNPILNNYYTMLKETNPEGADQAMEAVLNTLRIDADPSQLRGEEVSSAQPDIQITPASGTTTMAEFLGEDGMDTETMGAMAASNWTPSDIPQEVNQDNEFVTGVNRLESKYNLPQGTLWAIMNVETGGTFDPAEKAPNSTATGLIQFLSSTAKSLGTTTKELSEMTRTEQLEYVDKYLAQFKGRLGDNPEPVDGYLAVFYPRAIGKADDYVLFKEGSDAYESNKSLDTDKKGSVTKADVKARFKAKSKWIQ